VELYQRLKDEYQPLKDQIAKIYKGNGCDVDGTVEGSDTFPCGDMSDLSKENTVMWSFGRSGWAEAASTRKTFLTWTNAGSGSLTDAVLELTTHITVSARDSPNDNGPAVFDVTIDMSKFAEIPAAP
jgi:hypothetical protein